MSRKKSNFLVPEHLEFHEIQKNPKKSTLEFRASSHE